MRKRIPEAFCGVLWGVLLATAWPAAAQPTDVWTLEGGRGKSQEGRGRMERQVVPASLSPAPLAWRGSPVETGRLRRALNDRVEDPWLGVDKGLHVAFSFLGTLGSQYTLVNKIDLSERGALPVSVAAGAFVGLSKELYDWRLGPRRAFSYRDLAADALGILLAVGLILL